MSEKIYPKGIRVFPKLDKQPDFVLGTVVITLEELKENASYFSEYKGNKQLKLQLLKGKDGGAYFTIDTWKPDKSIEQKEKDLPF